MRQGMYRTMERQVMDKRGGMAECQRGRRRTTDSSGTITCCRTWSDLRWAFCIYISLCMSTHQLLHECVTDRYENCCDEVYHWRTAMVVPESLYSIYKCWKKAIFCTKWRHVACSMDIMLSKNPSEAGYTSSEQIILLFPLLICPTFIWYHPSHCPTIFS